MEKLWAGAAHGALDAAADSFNSSIGVDSRMYKEDIRGSMAHAAMLAKCGIISPNEGSRLIEGLGGILADLESGALAIDPSAEDIHSFVESELTARLGDVGKKLHTARSRNDQVALDTRLYLRSAAGKTVGLLRSLIRALAAQAERNADAVMPGYTHLQARAARHLRPPAAGLRHDVRARHRPHRGRRQAHERLPPRLRRAGRHHLPHRPRHDRRGAGLRRLLPQQPRRRLRPRLLRGACLRPGAGDGAPLPPLRGAGALLQLGVSALSPSRTPTRRAPPSCRRKKTPTCAS